MVDVPPMNEISARYGRSLERGANEYEENLLRRGKTISEACEQTDRYFAGAVDSSGADLEKLSQQYEGIRPSKIARALTDQQPE